MLLTELCLKSLRYSTLWRNISPQLSKHEQKFLGPGIVSRRNSLPYSNNCKIQKRFLTTRRKLPKTPDLIYVPQIMKWLKNKIKFKLLKTSWDPEFSEGAFIYGTTRAVCTITDIIHRDKPEQLDKLLTFSAKVKLVDYMTRRLSKVQKEIILLKPDDIKILVPLNVVLSNEGNKKNCRVAMRILGLKWHEHANVLKLVLVALQTEFLRDYSQGHKNSEWTISAFDILECGMLTQIPG